MGITLLNIDCMEYMKTVPDKYFDLAIVDPPYGIGADRAMGYKNNRENENKWIGGDWDTRPTPEYFNELFRVCVDWIIWGANYFQLPPSKSIIVWDKVNRTCFGDCELAFSSFDVPARIFVFSSSNLQGFRNPHRFHPTEKPVALYKWLLKNYAKPEMKILDTHGGSFSSAIACYDFGTVEYVGCELDKDYYDAAVKRFNYHKSQVKLEL